MSAPSPRPPGVREERIGEPGRADGASASPHRRADELPSARPRVGSPGDAARLLPEELDTPASRAPIDH